MGRTAYTEPQCLYKGALYLTFSIPLLTLIQSFSPAWSKSLTASLNKLQTNNQTAIVTDAVNFLDNAALKETDCLHRTGFP